MPKSNVKDYAVEDERMGITNVVDLVLGEMNKGEAQLKLDKNLLKFSQDKEEVKKAKETKFLTIKGLLEHPYFIEINEADISIVIDEFESF
jgi:hypothetical protein